MRDYDFNWAKALADEIDPEGGWMLKTLDYGHTVVLASECNRSLIWLARVGCNTYGPVLNLNEDDARETSLRSALEDCNRARALHVAVSKG